jgi:molybdenum cofactor cytidylyltransferase
LITGIILASGFSKRMEKDKLLLEVGGIPVIERVLKAAKSSLLDDIILVYQNEKVGAIGGKYRVRTVYNDSAHEGQSAAVKLGVRKSRPDTDAFMFLVGDQPFLEPATINTLIDQFTRNQQSIIVPVYNGKRGNPVIFPSLFRDNLLAIEGDRGGKMVIEKMEDRTRFVPMEESATGIDIDTQEEYERIQKLMPG